jgi:hypothetical protein
MREEGVPKAGAQSPSPHSALCIACGRLARTTCSHLRLTLDYCSLHY